MTEEPGWLQSMGLQESDLTQWLSTHTAQLIVSFPCGSAGKESACNSGDLGSIPGLGRLPQRRERLSTPVFWPGDSTDCIVHGVAKSQTQLSHFHFKYFLPANSLNRLL